MNQTTRSFRPSDFSWRDLPYLAAAFLVLSVIAVGSGLLLESFPVIWIGLTAGSGIALTLLYLRFGRGKRGGKSAS